MLLGIVADLFTHISVFTSDPLIYEVFSPSADTDEDPKELLRWEDLEDHDIFLRIEQGRLQQWGCVVRLMLVQLIRTLERRPEKYSPEGANTKPVLLLLDEFPQFGKLDIITSALATLRSKNVTVAIFCQSFADLDAIYGKDTRRIILDNCQYKLILGAGDPETQRFLSDMVGTTMLPMPSSSENYDEFGESSGHSISKCLSRERIIQPHEFASLKDAILLHPDGFCRVKKEAYRSTEPEAIDVSYVEL
jgi:type IV secretion system protein VirD4